MVIDFDMNDDALRESIGKHGIDLKQVICMEELAELQKEISKCIRHEGSVEHLEEEIADVLICIRMLLLMYGIKVEEVQQFINFKIDRQIARDQKI